jgi:hypothetical protein
LTILKLPTGGAARQAVRITAEPRVEPYRDRVIECIDPFGYLWEISQPISDIPTDEAVASVQDSWYRVTNDR